MRKAKILVAVWIALLLGGVVSVSYYRQHQFEEQIEKNIAELEKRIEEDSINLKKEWETLDKSDPVEISDYFRSELFSLYFIYFLDYNKYMQNPEKSFLSGTFQTQGYEYTVLEAHSAILSAYYSGAVEWDCHTTEITNQTGDYCELLSTYSTGEDFTWEEFINSEEYGVFLNEFYHLLETKKEVTLQKAHQQTTQYGEGTFSENSYQEVLSQSYVYLAQTAYNNYYTHKDQNDFVKAIMDAEIVYSVNNSLHNLDKISATTYIFSTPLSTGFIHIHSSFLDICIVFILSTCIVVATWIVLKKFKKGIER